ncbi:phosphoenolpyruvate--protein phosphotransferase [Tomitella gaofuii]|uniref:phosphoenolpyruvate--protein phosphotransferase n=1 Tax=Tomitella gaofuii TaxID=2760083 RepID=UPI0015FBA6BD|nr:putative PEP-binding protein [Tomitella gaofuii]
MYEDDAAVAPVTGEAIARAAQPGGAASGGQVRTGTPVVPGLAYGPVIRFAADRPDSGPVYEVASDARDEQAAAFDEAARTVAERLRKRASAASGAAAEVLQATAAMAEDRGWCAAVRKAVAAGSPAPHAVAAATAEFSAMFEKVGGIMAERITDLEDVRDRVVAEILGAPEPGIPVPTCPSVLVADDLAPADTSGLDPVSIIALVTRRGGPTSHTAIIARQLGIPCVVAVAGAMELAPGALVLVDGDEGSVAVAPPRAETESRIARWREDAAAIREWTGPGATADGHAVALLANVQDGASAEAAASAPAEGVGLLRTELAFLDRDAEPSVAEQAEEYRRVLDAFDGRKVVIRTLDAGSDKPLRFVDHGEEANPALGVRGIRVARSAPTLLSRQLEAISLAARGRDAGDGSGSPRVMAPMVATVDEARAFAAEVRAAGLVPGVMIEVPAAAILADRILAEVDFVSVGTNDLTQYVMAADRMSGELAEFSDPWQPAVLALLAGVAQAGRRAGKPVGVCGEAAADPALACVLTGLGVTSLSAAPAAIGQVGVALSRVTHASCVAAADAALAAPSAPAAREAARAALAG